MTTILAIETSSELASVAIWHQGQSQMRTASGVQNHSRHVLPMVQSLLQESGLRLNQCSAIAFGAGPGSFTGVRTACGIAQGLAFAAELPVLPISTLQTLAHACFHGMQAQEVLAILDARMGQVYWAQYRWQAGPESSLHSQAGLLSGEWLEVQAATLSDPAQVLAQAKPILCGNGSLAYEMPQLADCLAAPEYTLPKADSLAELAAMGFLRGQAIAPELAQPQYLRNKVALTTQERYQQNQQNQQKRGA